MNRIPSRGARYPPRASSVGRSVAVTMPDIARLLLPGVRAVCVAARLREGTTQRTDGATGGELFPGRDAGEDRRHLQQGEPPPPLPPLSGRGSREDMSQQRLSDKNILFSFWICFELRKFQFYYICIVNARDS